MRKSIFLVAVVSGYALPSQPCPIVGDASFVSSPNVLEIVTSDRAIIEWSQFSLESQETARFIQPHANASVLNRVMHAEPSQIMGRIESNGQVILLNPNGILVGKDAQIHTGSFIASSLDLCNEVFTSRKELVFQGDSKEIVQNLGSIEGVHGDVFLIGWNVDNQGSLKSTDGIAGALAAGYVAIRPTGSDRIAISENPFSTVFLHENEADALEENDGFLFSQLSVNGSVSSKRSDGRGGEVLLMGDQIEAWQLDLDVSGSHGGGTVFVGGGEKGENPHFMNAKQIHFGPSVKIHAESMDVGEGGKVVLYSEGHTGFHGSLWGTGGPHGGNGGFAEISGKNTLEYNGFVDLSAVKGERGTLLFDPIDITITTAAGGALNAAAGGCLTCALAPFTCRTNPATQPFLINNVTLSGILGGGTNVVLDATVGVGGGGTITVNPAANVTWSTTASLSLVATNGITVRANIQNSVAAGAIYLQSQNGPILINTAANAQRVSVGSQNGTTQICAPNADVILQPASVSGRHAQIGFNIATGGPGGICAGPIIVNCRDLNIFGPTNTANTSAQIGHGELGFSVLTPLSTTDTSTINVTARNINLENSPGVGAFQRTNARIGHGMQTLSPGSDMRGNLTVVASGTITLTVRVNQAGAFTKNLMLARIGHGGSGEGGGGGGYSVHSNLFVQSGGDLTLQFLGTVPYNSCGVGIGSGGNELATIVGDLTVISGGNLSMIGVPLNPIGAGHNGSFMVIGWFVQSISATVPTITGNISVSACNDILMHVNSTSNTSTGAVFGIGYVTQAGNPANVTGDVIVAAGRDLLFDATLNQTTLGAGRIGNRATAASLSNTFVAVGRNLTIQGFGGQNIGIQAARNVSVAVGGDLNLIAPPNGGAAFIGPDFGANAVTTRVYAGGSVTATSNAFGRAVIGKSFNTSAAFNTSLDVRAGGNLQLGSSFTFDGALVSQPTTGYIFLEADATLPEAALWSAGANQMTSICALLPPAAAVQTPNPPAIPLLLSPNCPGAVIQANSAAIDGNTEGSLSFVTAGLAPTPISLSTTAASPLGITLHSGPTNVLLVPQDLNIGVDVLLTNPNGNYDISGSFADDGFRDITIGTALTTSGSILVRANRDLTQNAAVTTSGAQPVSLFAGNAPFPGGNMTLNANVSSAGGDIILQAGEGLDCFMNGISSVVHLAGRITTTGAGNITINADNDISLFSPALPSSVELDAGALHTLAGSDTSLMDTILIKTGVGGDLLMISGHNMVMTNSDIAIPLTERATLVVDNCFPISPLIGTGGFIMDAASTIIGDPRIFTAIRSQNAIGGTINGAFFVPGTLFENTTTEVWCQYFSFPFPYPFPNLGMPYTIFYKDCLGQLTRQANVIVSQFFVDLHPFNEFPGWAMSFQIYVENNIEPSSTPYWLRRRNINVFNHPKSWTVIAY